MKRSRTRSPESVGCTVKRMKPFIERLRSANVVSKLALTLPTLKKISTGEIKSARHDEYHKNNARIRNNLKYKSNTIRCFSLEQCQEISDLLIAEICEDKNKPFGYALDVLYPEGIQRVVMDILDITSEEAVKVMYSDLYEPESEEDTESDSDPLANSTRKILSNWPLAGLSFPLSELLEATGQKYRGNLLGDGGYGVVYKGRLRHTDAAIKFLTEDGASSLGAMARTELGTSDDMLKRELAALAKFRHPNLVGVMGFSCDPLSAIVYEYVQGGSLYDRLHKNVTKPLQWKERSRILRDTCRGLTYLHTADKPMVHQDIKSQNILIGGDGTGKISDFGFALELPKVHANGRSLFTKTFARSEGYFPSELTSGKYSAKSDVYSYGVVMLETFCAEKVFTTSRPDPKLVDHLEDELRDVARFSLQQDKSIQKSSQELNCFYHHVIVQCLLRHSRRPTSREVMETWDLTKSSIYF